MTDDVLAWLQMLNPALLARVVQQDQRCDDFEIASWSVERLKGNGTTNPDGLWLFQGSGGPRRGELLFRGPAPNGRDERPWSLVLKILIRPENEQPPSDLWYWQRELLVAQSGLAARLPGPVKAPRFYRLDSQPESWLWMEHIQDVRPGPWTLESFKFAARELGRWNGALVLAGPPPDEPWLARQHYRTWLNQVDPERHWSFPLLLKHVSAELRARWDQLWSERDEFFGVLEALPQVFCHADAQRRNLAIRPVRDQAAELVVLDWGNCGLAPLGVEMSMLVFGNLVLGEWPSAAARELDTAAFAAYVAGLKDAGWQGEAATVRLAYLAWLAVFLGLVMPAGVHDFCRPETRDFCLRSFGLAEEELFRHWLGAMAFALDCADEARRLMAGQGYRQA